MKVTQERKEFDVNHEVVVAECKTGGYLVSENYICTELRTFFWRFTNSSCHRLHVPGGFLRPGVAKLKATTNSFSVHTSLYKIW